MQTIKLAPEKQLIQQGAEARLYQLELDGKMAVEKFRFEKKYRHPTIDLQTRKRRTKSEARCLQAASKNGISCPQIYQQTDFSIFIEFLNGQTLTELYTQGSLTPELLIECGSIIKSLHKIQIIHNDLTTSNFIYSNNKLYVIDFGLAVQGQTSVEVRAVDLYVLEKSILALTGDSSLFSHILAGYQADQQLQDRLDEVRKRGRKK
ncbi:TP53_regulating kinase [Hexamita inflata]|uniref:non-specific serine/threonine protein kinase n=1 Tax=Hexamita inflata TaxID=28002 RepID=A0ABP1HV57_9EUKA